MVSAEIPDKDINPELHDLVKKFMLHGPCVGYTSRSPCLDNKGKICEKHFPKPYLEGTTLSENGVITYRRRQPEKINKDKYSRTVTGVKVRGQQTDVVLNNQWVVPYNPTLLMKFNAHINVEVVASVVGIKYLFKYVSKGKKF